MRRPWMTTVGLALGLAGLLGPARAAEVEPRPLLGDPPGLASPRALPVSPRPIALKELILSTIERNLELRAQSHSINAAHRALQNAKAQQLPILTLTSTLRDSNQGRRLRPLGEVGRFLDDVADNHALVSGAVFKVPLYHGDRLAVLPRAARVSETIEIVRREDLRQELIRRVVELYADRLLLAKQLDLARDRRQKKEEDLKVIREREKNAFVLRQQVLAAELEIDEITQEELEFSNQLVLLDERIARTAGLGRAPFTLRPEIGMRDLDATLEEVARVARAKSPRIRALMHAVDLANEQVAIAKGKDQITVDLQVDYLEHFVFRSRSRDSDTYTALLSVNWDVFDGDRRDSEQKELRERRDRAIVELEDATVKLETEVRQTHNAYMEARRLLERTRKNVALARENLRTVQEKYDASILILADLMEARVNHQKAVVNRDRVLSSIIKARARLYALMGALTPELF